MLLSHNNITDITQYGYQNYKSSFIVIIKELHGLY